MKMVQSLGNTRVCQKHGTFEATTFINPLSKQREYSQCPKCSIEMLDNAGQQAKREHEQESECFNQKTRSIVSEIPPRFRGCSFDNYELSGNKRQSDNYRHCQKYVEKFDLAKKNGVSLIFCGTSGAGKTHLAMAIANKLTEKGYSVLFTGAYRMLSKIKEAQQERGQSEIGCIDSYAKHDLLIIDEIARQTGTDADKRVLSEVLDARYNRSLPSILITNLPYKSESGESFYSFIGEDRAVTRFQENSGKILVFDWENYRPKKNIEGFWD